MKFLSLWLSVFFLSVFGSYGQSTQGRLIIDKSHVYGGDTVLLTYSVDTSLFKSKQQLYLKAYMFDTTYQWSLIECKMSAVNNASFIIKEKFIVPKNAGLIAISVTDQLATAVDNNNDKGYYIMVNSHTGEFAPGAEAGYGLMRAPRYGYGIPEYFKDFSISDTAVYMWLNNEILRHHTSADILVMPYTAALYQYKHTMAAPEIKRAVNYLITKKGNDENFYKAVLIAEQYLKDTVLADSIRNVELQKYPNGYNKKKQDYKNFMFQRNPDTAAVAIENFLHTYPYAATIQTLDRLTGINYANIYRQLTACYIALRKNNKAVDMIDKVLFDNLAELYYRLVEVPYDDWKTLPADSALMYAQNIFDRWAYFSSHKPKEYWYMNNIEWKIFINKIIKHDMVLQARLLKENGKTQDALVMADSAQREINYSSADLNQTQSYLLNKLNQKERLHTVLAESIRQNQATEDMLEMLRKDYVLKNKTDKGFDNYVESLKDPHTMELIREEVKNSAVNIPTSEFSLEDQFGKTVSLNDLKGKTIVLDFWATWCAPCKASFPGMNMAKDYFKDNKNVVFFFVDTQERIPDYKQKTVDYLKSKGFDFHVLYDSTADVYKKYASLIHTSGIPFKIIINGNGTIRNYNVGYKGSPTGLKDEMVEMVKYASQH